MRRNKTLFTILLLAGTFFFAGLLAAWEEPVLTIYITRHAQRGPRSQWPEGEREKKMVGETLDGKYLPPSGDSITPLGVKQCELLGAYLKKLGFKGNVYSSPNFRAMQTAVSIAEAVDPALKVIPETGLQSGGNRQEPAKGMSCEELEKRFPGKVTHVALPEKWQLAGEFTPEARSARMTKFLEDLLKKEPKGEVLLVGHSSTIPPLMGALDKRAVDRRLWIPAYYVWNCSLHIYKLDRNGKVVFSSVENYNYLPEEMRTRNFLKPNPKVKPPRNFRLSDASGKGGASSVPAVKNAPAPSASPTEAPKLGESLKNGDFSRLVKVTDRNLRPRAKWEFSGELFPAPWELMGGGKAELKEKACEGKNVLRVEGSYPRLCQDITQSPVTVYTFSCKARGNCKLRGTMYWQGKGVFSAPVVALGQDWQKIEFSFTLPAEARFRVLSIQLGAKNAWAEFADCKLTAEK